ncbi:MAG: diacylglycerol kinase [Kiritimatiellia bacterium]
MKGISVEEIKQRAEKIKTAVELKSPEEIRKATEYSMRGVRAVLFGEKAFRTDLVVFSLCAVAVGALKFYGLIDWCESAVMIYTVFMALVGEIINTAIETTIDRISTEYHELSGRAKDIGSAIVFVSFFGAGIAWALILFGVAVRQGWLDMVGDLIG